MQADRQTDRQTLIHAIAILYTPSGGDVTNVRYTHTIHVTPEWITQ